jgi:hypothetical protein
MKRLCRPWLLAVGWELGAAAIYAACTAAIVWALVALAKHVGW